MGYFRSKGIEILGITAAVPTIRVGREEHLAHFREEIVDRVIENTGIRGIHLGQERGQTAGDLGYAAAKSLLEKLEIDRSRIGVLLFVSYATDYRKPGTSSVLQMRLGLSRDCMVTDIGQACSGFVYGHQVMESLLMSTDAAYGLLVLGDTGNRMVSRFDHTAMMLGDAGAAVLYGRGRDAEHLTLLRADGERFRSIILPAGGYRDMSASRKECLCSDGVMRTSYDLYMDGLSVLSFATNDVCDSVWEYLEKAKTDISDYDSIVFHQANLFILRRLMKKLLLSPEQVPISLDEYGNTSCASIPVTICKRYGGEIGKEQKHLLAVGFGIGLSWGVTSFHLSPDRIFPVTETDECYDEGRIDIETL